MHTVVEARLLVGLMIPTTTILGRGMCHLRQHTLMGRPLNHLTVDLMIETECLCGIPVPVYPDPPQGAAGANRATLNP